MTIFKKILDDKGVLVYSNKGKSMLPLIKEGRDILVIKRKQKIFENGTSYLYRDQVVDIYCIE